MGVRVLSEVCAEVFEELISSPRGPVVKLNGGTACLSVRGPRYPGFPVQLGRARSAELSARRGCHTAEGRHAVTARTHTN